MIATGHYKRTLATTGRYIVWILALFMFSSCKGKLPVDVPMLEMAIEASDHQWYAYSTTGIEKVRLPQHAKKAVAMPWTEAVRTSGDSVIMLPQQGGAAIDAYLLVNRLGVIAFDNGHPVLHKDPMLFDNNTAGNMFSRGQVAFFSFYKDRTFNTKIEPLPKRPFLLRYQIDSGISVPLVSYDDLGLDAGAEITGIVVRDKDIYICVKDYLSERNDFSYYDLSSAIELESLTPTTAFNALHMAPITQKDYRDALSPKPFTLAPKRLQELLSALPDTFVYSLEVRSLNDYDTLYESHKDLVPIVDGRALLTPTIAIAVFADGTTYIQGAMPGHAAINSGNITALRLPKLPAGYKYTNFIISGGALVVAWEEEGFYETGRSGFLVVDTEAVFKR